MVYLNRTEVAQSMLIPKDLETEGSLSLVLKNTTGLDYTVSAEVLDLGISSMYLNVAVVLPSEVREGEYEYVLSDSTGTISTGVVTIREKREVGQYEKEISYEQYETR